MYKLYYIHIIIIIIIYYQCTDLSDTVMYKTLQWHCTVNYKTIRNANKQWQYVAGIEHAKWTPTGAGRRTGVDTGTWQRQQHHSTGRRAVTG